MMLSIFSCAYLPPPSLPLWSLYSNPLPIFNWIVCVLWSFKSSLYILDNSPQSSFFFFFSVFFWVLQSFLYLCSKTRPSFHFSVQNWTPSKTNLFCHSFSSQAIAFLSLEPFLTTVSLPHPRPMHRQFLLLYLQIIFRIQPLSPRLPCSQPPSFLFWVLRGAS